MIRIFVGSLPYTTSNEELQKLFESFGAVTSATIITDKFSGQSKGFGFVEMANDEEANKAIQELNGYQLGGRGLAVSVARPREERPARDNFRSGGFDDRRSGGFNSNRGSGGSSRGGSRSRY